MNRSLCGCHTVFIKIVMSSKLAKSKREFPVPGQSGASAKERPLVIETDVDGNRVRLVAKDEIVLECGKASITLRRNGRIIVRGTHVETNSEGTNRIKGGQVQIN
jgi:hypothetical protein